MKAENLACEAAGDKVHSETEVSTVRGAETDATQGRRGGRPTVLVVDDFEDTRQMLRQFLETRGYSVCEAVNGREAIETARNEHPALVLMDLNMPVLDGFTATLRIREDERMRALPVVAMTAYDTAEFRAAARAVGCTDYVVKPLDFNKLASLVESLLPEEEARTTMAGGGEAAG